MLSEGTTAPDFELSGLSEPREDDTGDTTRQFESFRLSEFAGDAPILLAFYPGDFSPVCTDELCSLRDIDLAGLPEASHVYGISRDSLFTHEAFSYDHELSFPLLSDIEGDVCREYDAIHKEGEDIEGRGIEPGMAKRTIYILDATRTIRYAWQTDDPYVAPDIENVAAELEALAE